MQIERVGQTLQRHLLLGAREGTVLACSKLAQALQAMLDRLGYAPNKDVRISDLRKSHTVKFYWRKPRRCRRLEDRSAVPGAFEGFANPNVIFWRRQPCNENAIGTETEESFTVLLRRTRRCVR